jgi:hypothetical protein
MILLALCKLTPLFLFSLFAVQLPFHVLLSMLLRQSFQLDNFATSDSIWCVCVWIFVNGEFCDDDFVDERRKTERRQSGSELPEPFNSIQKRTSLINSRFATNFKE